MQLIRRLFSFRMSNPILSGLCHAFVWMFVGALILSFFLWMSGMREQDLSTYTYVAHGLSLIIGGFIAGKRSGEKGWYYGGLTGIVYGLLVLLIGFLALDASFNWKDSLQLLSAFLLAAFGGIFGVNTHRSS
ncbi:TIGR04086 family membrane protein [Paenibacillus sp. TC-CSREp1]|uniref:TIGR04086 family membrane protein n=1 Tax=Paenibacillus sp. TC-CSREp1 TaxID=3410089 RepID=UPI003D065B9B